MRFLYGWFVVRDTRKTLAEVGKLTADTQRDLARRFGAAVEGVEDQMRGPNPGTAFVHQMMAAKAARHEALARGATHWRDPDWAAAALLESYLMGRSGRLGSGVSARVNGMLADWVRRVG